MRQYIVFFYLIFNLVFSAKAFNNHPLDYLGVKQGLSNNSVTSVYQDSFGFMWFGTHEGLNRFDGHNFKIFNKNLNDSTSLINDRVIVIKEDSDHNIWIGTWRGVSVYNPINSKFKPVYYSTTKGSQKLICQINAIETDTHGNVFVGGTDGLIYFNKSKKQTTRVLFKATNYIVQSIKIDRLNQVWLFIENYGLARFDYRTNSIILVNSILKAGLCMEADHQGNIWVGNKEGLYQYNIKESAYKSKTGYPQVKMIADLLFDKRGNLWISTGGKGIVVLDIQTLKFRQIQSGPGKGALSSAWVRSIYEDKQQRKWIATEKGGINILDEKKNRFTTISHDPFNKNSLVNDFTFSFCEAENGNIWIGTDGAGISYWDRKKNTFKNYAYDNGNAASLSSNNVASIVRDYKNDIWIATFGGGINKFNKRTNSFEHYTCFNTVSKLFSASAWLVYEDGDKRLWAGVCGPGGLFLLNRKTNRFELFDDKSNLKEANILTLGEDKQGVLWAGNFEYLFKIDRKTKEVKEYKIEYPVRAVYEDSRNNFWIGTQGGGLLKFDRKTGQYKSYTKDKGLAGNSVLNILEDRAGNLWISTFSGLSRMDAAGKIKNFYESDGLQDNQFNYNAALKLSSGELLFGGIKGFNIFFPEHINPVNNQPKILITGLRINNIPYEEYEEPEGKKSVYELTELTLPYDKAILSVDFTALEYSAPDKISYSYFLDGWDNSWNKAGESRIANYSRLREGTYFLRIKSTNTEGVWIPNERVLKVTVLPPWWRSWWAYCIYMAMGIAVFYVYSLYQRRQERLKYQIQFANAKAEQEKELNEKKFAFFTNISHEFRTPLTLIISPIQEFLNSPNSQIDSKELTVVYRNAKRLLSLVDQLLHFRKSDAYHLKVSKFNMTAFVSEVYSCFIQQAKLKKITFEFINDQAEIEVYADKEKIEIALFNLISNAFKYTPAGGSIRLKLSESDTGIRLAVSDTGTGIPENVGSRLFEEFYQVKDGDSVNKTGFGIGLHLVKKFVDIHSGKVSYSSKKGEGTEFTIDLLKGNTHFDSKVIFESFNESPVLQNEPGTDELWLEEEILQSNTDRDLEAEIISDRPSILIVDNDEEIRNYMKGIFWPSYQVYEANTGEQGYELTMRYVPDIIITDVVMGVMSGVELCLKIKEDASLNHIPVVLLTSSTSAEIKLKGIEGGADDYITKPFDKHILIARVSNLLKNRNNLQRYFYNQITFKEDESTVSVEYKEFLNKCIAIVEKHLLDPKFNVHTFAEEMGMSYSSLFQKVKSISGRSINEFIRFIRLREAAKLFINTDCNISEVAFQCGFNDMTHFRKQFGKLFGMNPSEYIRSYRKAFNKTYKLSGKIRKA
ncbi:hybrid sensor histidine kinase/response regulator transcription factor [Pedobacter punctiformis]|uniref:histidine kinase n=1 Tax=Pedobacter punctiformis TaxID=3004097 RepID=A0ABT4L9B7_9SPHI|nr:hybrid sensor histidine kinase/response regulator transcription factor [Pedobacter sp. HCMS5-2]MCZ4244292.1 ATP-binding protein [Pedobacter sp. HCMS5-2]